MSSFEPGFASRHQAAADALQRAFAPAGFAPGDIATSAAQTTASAARPPRHFSPVSRDHNPTEGWDPFDVDAMAGEENDPIASAHAAGFAAGRAAALAEGGEAAARDRALIEGVAEALGGAHHVDRDRIALKLRQTVLQLVAKLVGEIGISPELLAARVEAAVELLADSAESALLRLNPADVPLVEGLLPKTVFAAGDAGIARGAFVVESASTIVEDGPEIWIEQLAQAIDRVPIPGTPC